MRALRASWGALLALSCARSAPPSRFPSARSAIDRIRSSQFCSRALSGEGRFDYLGDDGRVRARALYVVAKPDRLRFDVLSPLGGVLSTLTSNGSRFAFLDSRQRRFLYGPASECNVEQALQVPVPPGALGELLTGQAPILLHEPHQAQLSWEGGAYLLQIESRHAASQRVRFVPREQDWALDWQQQTLRVVEVEVAQAGRVLYRAELAEHRSAHRAEPRADPDGWTATLPASGPECQAEVPRRVRFVVPGAGRDIVLSQKAVQHNPPLTAGLFEQSEPQGVVAAQSLCWAAEPPRGPSARGPGGP